MIGLERYEEGLALADRAIALDPREAHYYIIRGNALHGLGRYEEAAVSHNQAIELDPSRALYRDGGVETDIERDQ